MLQLKRTTALLLCATVLMLVSGTQRAAQAQGTPRPNLTALIYSTDGKGASAQVFTPTSKQGREIFKVSEQMNALLSDEAAWVVLYGTIDQAGTFAASYGRTGDAKTTPLPVEKGFTFIGGSFNPSSTRLAYTLARLPEQPDQQTSYILSVLDLTTGKITSYPGTVIFPTGANGAKNPVPQVGFYGGPLTIGWLDDNRQVVSPFVPFSDGGIDGLYVLDLSAAPAGPLPAAKPLTAQPITGFSYKIFSPDHKRLAYAFGDPKRPIPNLDGPFANTVGVLDIASGKTAIIAAPKDNGVGNGLTFSPDGSKVYFNIGPYILDPATGGPIMQGAKVLIADAATGQTADGPLLVMDTKAVVNQMQACGTTLFYSVSKTDPNAPTSQLVAAPLANLSQQTTLYDGTGYVTLVGCAP